MMTRVMLITGGAQGIGRGIVRHMLAAGWAVEVFDTDAEALSALREEHLEWTERLGTHEVDVSDESQVRDGMERALDAHDGTLHALVNNAAISSPYHAPIEELDLKVWRRYLDVNLTGAMLVTKHAVPALRKGRGAIVNIASTRALQSEPNHEAYATAKGGLCALTHALAVSLGPDIRVNAILPGWIAVEAQQKPSERQAPELRDIDHEQHPVGRVGRAEDIAHAVAYLVSDDAGFVTGQQLVIDGGMTIKMHYAE